MDDRAKMSEHLTQGLTPPTTCPDYTLPGGAKRSEKAAPYHLIPPKAIERIARRFGLGAERYGEWNWLRSLDTREHAVAFCIEAYNHMMAHAHGMGKQDDDDLGAVGWALCVIAEAEGRYGRGFWRKVDYPVYAPVYTTRLTPEQTNSERIDVGQPEELLGIFQQIVKGLNAKTEACPECEGVNKHPGMRHGEYLNKPFDGIRVRQMAFSEFERDAISTINHSPNKWPGGLLAYHALGLAEEAGEVVGKIKKALREYTPLDSVQVINKVVDELSDVLWYMAAMCHDMGVSLETVAVRNIRKRADRAARGVIKGEGDDR